MERVLKKLRNTDQGAPRYICWACVIDITPTLLIAVALAYVEVMLFEIPETSVSKEPFSDYFFSSVVLAPWIETLLMGLILAILEHVIRGTVWLAAVSGIIWGILHGIGDPSHGVVVTWSFFVQSLCFLEWSKKSLRQAVAITAFVHTCHNLVAVTPLLLSRAPVPHSPLPWGKSSCFFLNWTWFS